MTSSQQKSYFQEKITKLPPNMERSLCHIDLLNIENKIQQSIINGQLLFNSNQPLSHFHHQLNPIPSHNNRFTAKLELSGVKHHQIKNKIFNIEKEIYHKQLDLKNQIEKLATIEKISRSSSRVHTVALHKKHESKYSLRSGRRQTQLSKEKQSKELSSSYEKSQREQSILEHLNPQKLQKMIKFHLRLKQLKEDKKNLESKRKDRENKKKQKYEEEENQLKQELEERRLFEKEHKKALIKERLKKLDQYKKKRQELLASKSSPVLPKYKIMEKNFLFNEVRKEIQQKIQERSKREKKLKQFDSESIRRHQKQYINRIKEAYGPQRFSSKASLNNQSSGSQDASLKKFILIHRTNQSNQGSEERKQQIKKRKQIKALFEEKVKRMKIKTSSKKRLEALIAKDKVANPVKYNFLHLKSLNDRQIYEEFKQFNIVDIDMKKIGNQYLEEIKKVKKRVHTEDVAGSKKRLENSRISNELSSQKTKKIIKSPYIRQFLEKNIKTPQIAANKNVLEDLKAKDTKINKNQIVTSKTNLDINKMFRMSENKSKVIEMLSKQSIAYESKAMKKIKTLGVERKYADTIKLENDIDQDYLNSVKAKVGCLALQKQ